MELNEFIKAAITDITDAISELQEDLKNGAVVSPSMPAAIDQKTIDERGVNRLITDIDFDVAITVGNTDSINGKIKAGIQIFSARITGGNEARTENVSRMSFSIPVIFPTAIIKTDREMDGELKKEKHRASRPKNPLSLSAEISSEENNMPNQTTHTQ